MAEADAHAAQGAGRVGDSPVYVRRDAANRIISVSRVPAPDHVEAGAADRTEVIAFVGGLSPRVAALLESDLSLIRALEDLIDVLIRKDVLRLTDLPERVQAKLLARRNLRGSLHSLRLLDEDNGLI